MRTPLLFLAAGALAVSGCHAFKSKPKTPTTGPRISVLDFETKAKAEPELASLAVVLPPPTADADWPQPGGTPAKNGGHLALPDTLSVAWTVRIGKGSTGQRRLNAAPVVAGGRIFTIDTDGTVAAFDVATGHRQWSQRIEQKKHANAAFGGGVSVADGHVYATTGFGAVVAFDVATGATVWRKELGLPCARGDRCGRAALHAVARQPAVRAVG